MHGLCWGLRVVSLCRGMPCGRLPSGPQTSRNQRAAVEKVAGIASGKGACTGHFLIEAECVRLIKPPGSRQKFHADRSFSRDLRRTSSFRFYSGHVADQAILRIPPARSIARSRFDASRRVMMLCPSTETGISLFPDEIRERISFSTTLFPWTIFS